MRHLQIRMNRTGIFECTSQHPAETLSRRQSATSNAVSAGSIEALSHASHQPKLKNDQPRSCNAGASVNSYYLGGYVTSAVTPPSRLDVLAMSADSTNGVLSAAFTLNLTAADVAKLSAFDIIYSQGSLDSSGNFIPHPVQPVNLRTRTTLRPC